MGGTFDNSKRIKLSETSAFESYTPISRVRRSQSLPVNRILSYDSRPIPHAVNSGIIQLTRNLLTTYKTCHPQFKYTPTGNPRRVLTKDSDPISNDGHDNATSDYILYVNDIIGSYSNHQYQILDLLGQGTFGQVVKAINVTTKELTAIKIVKNKPAYFNQGLVEIQILEMLNHQLDPDNMHYIVRLTDYFVFRNHLCLVFELLSVNLYELLKQNNFKGLSMTLIKCFLLQILEALATIGQSDVVHCDLKPENILLQNLTSPQIKVIDFGSACFENRTVYSYIQSRFYRSPEVLLGVKYTSAIDMWSLGCISAELFLGLPLLPGNSEYNQICRIIDMFGDLPEELLLQGDKAHLYFNSPTQNKTKHTLKTEEEYARDSDVPLQPAKKYFKYKWLADIINNYTVKEDMSTEDIEKERKNRIIFIDFLRGLLCLDPKERWTAAQARSHPFLTGEAYNGQWVPPARVNNHTKPRVIPWGIQPAALTQRHVSMSFPENYMAYENFTPQGGNLPAYNHDFYTSPVGPSNVPVGRSGNAHLQGAMSYDTSFGYPDASPRQMIPPGMHMSVYGSMSSPWQYMNSNMNVSPRYSGYNQPPPQIPPSSPRSTNNKVSPRMNPNSPRMNGGKNNNSNHPHSNGYNGGYPNAYNPNNNHHHDRANGNAAPQQGRARSNSRNNRQRSKSEAQPYEMNGKAPSHWNKQPPSHNRGNLVNSKNGKIGTPQADVIRNSGGRRRTASGNQASIPRPNFEENSGTPHHKESFVPHHVHIAETDDPRDSSSDSPDSCSSPPQAEWRDDDIFDLEVNGDSPNHPHPTSKAKMLPQMQQQREMYNNFSNMRLGNGGNPMEPLLHEGRGRGQYAHGRGAAAPTSHSQSLPSSFYGMPEGMSPHHMHSAWLMQQSMAAPPYPPPNHNGYNYGMPGSFGHLAGHLFPQQTQQQHNRQSKRLLWSS
ncbi:hypothetical protein PROFUN_11649 [Planoprotostelium fungivorum]|uniref:Protein kinase domain-containing protein n=1 Tax=Planoprotostelium fungivorum TaxID=1890364 RepID=A0A2P6N9S5_9EUKA|nr:hypothetical protein PROFUN_11649 [Planoprotostelium fungivorum]